MTMIMRDIMALSSDRHITYHLQEYCEIIKQSFKDYIDSIPPSLVPTNNIPRLIERFNDTVHIDQSSRIKYFKIITLSRDFRRPIVHSFILKKNDRMFYQGDILRAECHRDPYRDRSYGNIFTDDYKVSWHRPLDIG